MGLGGVGNVDLTIGDKTYQDISGCNGYVGLEGTWFSISDKGCIWKSIYRECMLLSWKCMEQYRPLIQSSEGLHTVDPNDTLDNTIQKLHMVLLMFRKMKLWLMM